MTTSPPMSFLSEILSGEQIPIGKLAYFRARLSNRIHELVLAEFVKLERDGKINKAQLAKRIGRKPEQVTRWLGASGNWTIETLSDLLLGMGREPTLTVAALADMQTKNFVDEAPLAPALAFIEASTYRLLGSLERHPATSAEEAMLPSAMPTSFLALNYGIRAQIGEDALTKGFGPRLEQHPMEMTL